MCIHIYLCIYILMYIYIFQIVVMRFGNRDTDVFSDLEKGGYQCGTEHKTHMEYRNIELIFFIFFTGNSTLEPLIEGLFAQIHIQLS